MRKLLIIVTAITLGLSLGIGVASYGRLAASPLVDRASDKDIAARSAVFMIFPYTMERTKGGGTAFLLNTKNEGTVIVTNRHICDYGDFFYLIKDNAWYVGTKIAVSETTDLCVIQPPKEILAEYHPLSLSDKQLKKGDTIHLWGHPRLRPLTHQVGKFISINWEPILTTKPFAPEFKMYVGSMEIEAEPGNSGSPILDTDGLVVGVLFAIDRRVNQVLFIPQKQLKEFVELVR